MGDLGPQRQGIMVKEGAKASHAAKIVKKGAYLKSTRKIRTKPNFHRPKTLALPRDPRYPRLAKDTTSAHRRKMDHWQIIKYPLATESAMKKIEENNTLVFIVDVRANKFQIQEAVKKMYEIQAEKINTLIQPNGAKKAFVRLTSDVEALDVANKIGII